jgi:hypothetical protein
MNNYKFDLAMSDPGILNQEEVFNDIFIKTQFDDSCIDYTSIHYSLGTSTEETFVQVDNPITLLCIPRINTAHAISEIIDFLLYYFKNHDTITLVGIANTMKIKMPFLFKLICLFIPIEKIFILEDTILYKCSKLITYRLHHFNVVHNWNHFDYIEENINGKNRLTFSPKNTPFHYLRNPDFLFEKIRSIYVEHHTKFQLYDKIMLIKTSKDTNIASKNRCMEYPSDSIFEKLKTNNIHFLNLIDVKSIEEYICILYHAKIAIFSYGGPACTNRFFCNPEATVIVFANNHYSSEWNADKQYSHIRHSHLHPVNKQIFLLDFANHLDDDNLQEVLNIANSAM